MKSRCRAIIVVSQQRSKRVIISKAKVPGTRWKRPAFRSVSVRSVGILVDNQYTDNDTHGACFLTKYIKIYSFDDDSKRIPILIKKENRRFCCFILQRKHILQIMIFLCGRENCGDAGVCSYSRIKKLQVGLIYKNMNVNIQNT